MCHNIGHSIVQPYRPRKIFYFRPTVVQQKKLAPPKTITSTRASEICRFQELRIILSLLITDNIIESKQT